MARKHNVWFIPVFWVQLIKICKIHGSYVGTLFVTYDINRSTLKKTLVSIWFSGYVIFAGTMDIP